MLPIYICEDSLGYREELKQIINHHICENNLDMEIVCSAASENELLDHLTKHTERSLYFLDLHLKDSASEGFCLAQKIRKYDPRGFIVIVTTYDYLNYLTFEYHIEAMDYIVKNKKGLSERVLSCLKEAGSLSKRDNLSDDGIINIDMCRYKNTEIYCIRAANRPNHIYIESIRGIVSIPKSLSETEGLLDETFYRCHQSYIVNVCRIIKVDGNTATLDNGKIIPVSRRMAPGLNKIRKKYNI